MIAFILAFIFQFAIPHHTGALASVASTTTYGDTTSNSVDYEGANILIGMYLKTGANAETPSACKQQLAASTNASGSQISCAIYSYSSTSAFGSLVSGCSATTYTAPSANLAAQTISLPFSGCTLAANTAYWIIVNTNDGNFRWQTDNCGGTCTGAIGTSTYPPAYSSSSVTYGTNTTGTAYSFDAYRFYFQILATP